MATTLIVPVTLIEQIYPHPNADRLEIAHILGWQVVIPKGAHYAGQKVVYFPHDSVMPPEVSDRFGVTQYLNRGRVRAARLRGEYSFGFAVPPDNPDWEVGENVAEYYGATKYEPPIRPIAGDAEHSHPLFVSYTDIENLRNFLDVLTPGEAVVISEKIHGTNCRLGIIEGEWMAGSMGVRRKRPEEDQMHLNTYWYPYTLPAVRALVEQVAQNHRQGILFGEVYGSKIQSFHYGLENRLGFAAFDFFVDGRFLDWSEFAALCQQFDLPTVPVLYEGPYSLEVVRRSSEGKTIFPDSHIREVVVFRPSRERMDPRLGRAILKYLGDAYMFDDKKTDFTDR